MTHDNGAYDKLESVWRDRDGGLWRTVGVITDPAVIIEQVSGFEPGVMRERQTHVLGSPNMVERFVELRPIAVRKDELPSGAEWGLP